MLLQLVWSLFYSSAKKEESPWVAGAEKAGSPVAPKKDRGCSPASEKLLPACLVYHPGEKHLTFQENNLHLYKVLSRVLLVGNAQ